MGAQQRFDSAPASSVKAVETDQSAGGWVVPTKRPWFPFWVFDYLTDRQVLQMTMEERGIYLQLLCLQWVEGSIPNAMPTLCAILGFGPDRQRDPECEARLKCNVERVLTACFEPIEGDPDHSWNRRLAQEQATAEFASLQAKRSAGKRWQGGRNADALPGQSDRNAIHSHSHSHSSKTTPTWLTPFWDAWVEAYGGEPSGGQLAKALAKLVKQHGEQPVLQAWGAYLRATPARFASPPAFSSRYGSWANGTAESRSKTPFTPSTTSAQRQLLGKLAKRPTQEE